MAKYRAAIIGCGRMGGSMDDEVPPEDRDILPYSHASAYSATPEVEMVACADLIPERVERFARRWKVRGYDDYQKMIDREQPDIVSVATGGPHHADPVVYAATHGARGIYCEKGMCCSLRDADRMRDACLANRVQFRLGAWQRYQPGYRAIRRMVDAGELGEIRSVTQYGGGVIIHGMSHHVDALQFLAGDPEVEYVQGQLQSPLGHRAYVRTATGATPYQACQLREQPGFFDPASNRFDYDPDMLFCFIQFKNGVAGVVTPTTSTHAQLDLEVQGLTGAACIAEHSRKFYFGRQSMAEHYPRYAVVKQWKTLNHRRTSTCLPIVGDLIAGLEGARPNGDIITSHRSTEVLFATVASHLQNGARVTFPVPNRDLVLNTW